MDRTQHSSARRAGRWTRTVAAAFAASLLAFGAGGCETTGQGLFSGAAVGGLAGLGLGSLSGDAGKGAAAGAIIGGVTGAVIGNQNERDRVRYAETRHTNDAYYYNRGREDERRHYEQQRHDDRQSVRHSAPATRVHVEKKVIHKRTHADLSHAGGQYYEREYEREIYRRDAPVLVHHYPEPRRVHVVHRPTCDVRHHHHRHHDSGYYSRVRPGPAYYHKRDYGRSGVYLHVDIHSKRYHHGHHRSHVRLHKGRSWGPARCR